MRPFLTSFLMNPRNGPLPSAINSRSSSSWIAFSAVYFLGAFSFVAGFSALGAANRSCAPRAAAWSTSRSLPANTKSLDVSCALALASFSASALRAVSLAFSSAFISSAVWPSSLSPASSLSLLTGATSSLGATNSAASVAASLSSLDAILNSSFISSSFNNCAASLMSCWALASCCK